MISPTFLGVLGSEYINAYATLSIYLFAVCFSLTFEYLQPLLLAYGRVKTLAKINTVNSVIYISLTFPMLNLWGTEGFAFSYLVFMMLSIGWRYFVFLKIKEEVKNA